MKQVYCLYRVSSLGQVEKNDIPMQKIACHTFAECQGWEIVKEFAEKGISGYKRHMEERDAIMQIKEDALLGKFEILLVFTFDRIGRRDDETPFVVEWMVKQGVAVWSVCEGEQRFDNHVDKLTNYIRYWQAAGESERISERTRTRIRQLTSEGRFTGGVCPFGYKLVRQGRENKKGQSLYDMDIDEDEAKIVRLMFEKTALEGYGAYRLANLLNERQLYPRSGRPRNGVSLYGILKNQLYTGVVRKADASAHCPELQIVPDELYQEAQKLREARTKRKAAERTAPSIRGAALLNGFLYCGTCGSRMSSNHVVRHHVRADGSITVSRTQRYYCCQKKDGLRCQCIVQHTYVTAKVEALFLKQLSDLLLPLLSCSPQELAEQRVCQTRSEIGERYTQVEADRNTVAEEIALLEQETLACLRGKSKFSAQQISDLLASKKCVAEQIDKQLCSFQAELLALNAVVRETQFRIEKHQHLWIEYQTACFERKKVILSCFVLDVKISIGYTLGITECGHIANLELIKQT